MWCSITLVSPAEFINLSSGFVGSACNLLPTLLPAVVFSGDGARDVSTLAVVAAMAVVAFGAGGWLEGQRLQREPKGRTMLPAPQP